MRHRLQKEDISVDLGVENMMSFIYGQAGHSCCAGWTSTTEWRKMVIPLVGTIQRAILKNVHGDDPYRKRLSEHCDLAMSSLKRAKSKDKINCLALKFSFSLIFRLLGRMPHNWESKRAHHSKVTDLSQHRLLNYVRTDTMKAREILDYAYRDRLGDDAPTFQTLIEAFNYRFAKNPNRFLNWFSQEFPEIFNQYA